MVTQYAKHFAGIGVQEDALVVKPVYLEFEMGAAIGGLVNFCTDQNGIGGKVFAGFFVENLRGNRILALYFDIKPLVVGPSIDMCIVEI